MTSTFTASDKHRALLREISQRQKVYPRLVGKGSMRQAEASREIAVMQAIASDYRERAEAEDAAGRLF